MLYFSFKTTEPALNKFHLPSFHSTTVLARPEDFGHGTGASIGIPGNLIEASKASLTGDSPEIFALVVARGPVRISKSLASFKAGTLKPKELELQFKYFERFPIVGKIIVKAPGQ